MNYQRLREIYSKILNGESTKEERLELLDNHNRLGGMSIEWFLSNLNGSMKEPIDEEVSQYTKTIESIIMNDL